MTDAVLVDIDDGLMVITINRPDARSAIDAAVSYGVCAGMNRTVSA
jgi:enoyl-CoA hydratase